MRTTALLGLCLLLIAPGRAQDDSPTVLPAEAAQRLRDGWTKLRGGPDLPAPSVGVFVTTTGGSSAISEQVVADDLRAQLAPQGITVVSSELAAKGGATLRSALERRGQEEVAARVAELMAEAQKADIAIVVQLLAAPDGTAARQLRVFDTRHSPVRPLTSQSYRALPLTPPSEKMQQAFWYQAQRQITTAMLIRVAEALHAAAPYVPTYRVQVLGLGARDHERWMRALRRAARPGLELLATPAEFGTTKANVTPLAVRYPGHWLDLKDLLEASAKESLNRGLLTVFSSGGSDYILSLQDDAEPSFARFAAENAAAPKTRVGPALSKQRRPTVVVLHGADLEAPQAALLDERNAPPPLAIDEETAARTLGRFFAASGFEVKDPRAIRRQLEDEITRAKLAKNLSGTRDALRRLNATDYVVLMRKEPSNQNLALTVIDARGSQVAFTAFPDLRHRLFEELVDAREPMSVMRYLAGALLGQLHDQAEDAAVRAIEVLVKNTRDAQQILTVANAFRGLEGVKAVSDLKIESPLGSFLVTTTEEIGALVDKAAQLAAERQLGAKGIVEVANEQQLVLNVAPEWFSAFDRPEAMKKTEQLQKPETPKPPGLVEAMRAARDSVWIVGLDLADGEFTGGGTAWTVRPGLLATNAHVLHGLLKRAKKQSERQRSYQAVARNGAGLERSLAIDLERSRVHPAYLLFGEIYGRHDTQVGAYDVAFLVVTGDAGRPLPLASQSDLAALQALDVVGYVGFPQENRSGSGRSQLQIVGTINALTSVFLQDTKDNGRRLILHHTLAVAGGASGSPLFGSNGMVIGLVNAGDFVSAASSAGGKISEGNNRVPVGFFYGQRVDMLSDLLDGKGSAVNLDALKAEWAREFQVVKQQLGQ